jgi:hypothetical protein
MHSVSRSGQSCMPNLSKVHWQHHDSPPPIALPSNAFHKEFQLCVLSISITRPLSEMMEIWFPNESNGFDTIDGERSRIRKGVWQEVNLWIA